MIFKPNTSDSMEANTGNVVGICFNANLIAAANNTDLITSDFDSSNVQLDIKLLRNGKTIQIYTGALCWVSAASQLFTQGFRAFGGATSEGFVELVSKGVSTKETIIVPFPMGFGGAITLLPGDKLITVVNYQDTAFTGTVDKVNSCIDAQYIYSLTELELGTPRIELHPLTAAIASFERALPTNCHEAYFINRDKVSSLTANAVVNSVTIQSELGSVVKDRQLLLGIRNSTVQDTIERGNTFQLFTADQYGLPNGKVSLALISGNVTASNNAVVCYWKYYDAQRINTYNANVASKEQAQVSAFR